MKYLLAILLCISLYAPDIARIIAYTDYVVDVVSAKKINICNCQDVLDQKEKPEDHSKHIAIVKTEFAYIVPEVFTIQPATALNATQPIADVHQELSFMSFDIFQPPRV